MHSISSIWFNSLFTCYCFAIGTISLEVVSSEILSFLSIVLAQKYQRYALKVLTDPSNCVAGEVCVTQPSVAVIFVSSGEIAYSFQGSMYVNLAASPTGYEKLYIGSGCTVQSCGQVVANSVASVSIVNGIASFSVSK